MTEILSVFIKMKRFLPPAAEDKSDAGSDSSFVARQKEFHSLLHEFSSAIESIRPFALSPLDHDEGFNASVPHPVHLSASGLIEEIKAMQSETTQIAALLGQPQFQASPRAKSIAAQLQYLERMHSQLLTRATALCE
jgi:hypothetical protein